MNKISIYVPVPICSIWIFNLWVFAWDRWAYSIPWECMLFASYLVVVISYRLCMRKAWMDCWRPEVGLNSNKERVKKGGSCLGPKISSMKFYGTWGKPVGASLSCEGRVRGTSHYGHQSPRENWPPHCPCKFGIKILEIDKLPIYVFLMQGQW
jgi:hypothetical protein